MKLYIQFSIMTLSLTNIMSLEKVFAEDLNESNTQQITSTKIIGEENRTNPSIQQEGMPIEELVIELSAPLPRTDGEQRISIENLVWTPVSTENMLGGADDFNAILFDSFYDFHEVGGPVATGHLTNVNIVTFPENLTGGVNQFYDYTIPKFNVALITQNGIKDKVVKILNGDTLVNHKDYLDMMESSAGSVFTDQAKINQFMVAAKTDLVALNQRLWKLPVTGQTENDQWNRMKLVANQSMNVFEIDPSTSEGLNIIDTSSTNTIIIKLKGNTLKIPSIAVNNEIINYQNINKIANRILWVFDPGELQVTFQATNLTGSVLATNANVHFTGGYSSINGTLIANSLNGSHSNSELHYVGRYMGKLPTEPTEPSSSSELEVSSEPSSSSEPEFSTESGSSSEPKFSSEPSSSSEPKFSTESSSSSEPESSTAPSISSEPNSSSEPKVPLVSESSSSSYQSTDPSEQRGQVPKTGGASNKPTKGSKSKNNRLPQTGEGDSIYEKLFSLIGIGIFFTGSLIYFKRQRRSKE